MLASFVVTMALCAACEEAGGNPFGAPFAGPKSWKSEAAAPPGPGFDAAAASVTPDMIKRIEPRYPPAALENEIQGRVVARFQIAPGGAPFNIEIESSVDPVFNSEVIYALRNSRFAPQPPKAPVYAGRWYRQPYAFKLEPSASAP